MSTSQIPEQPNNESRPSATSPSPAASGGTQAAESPKAEPFKFGANAPAWAQGKTAEEVLGIAEKLNGVVTTYVQNGSPPQQQQVQQTAYQPQQPATQQIDDSAYLTGADINRFAPRLIDQQTTPQFDAIYESVAQTNLASVKRDNAQIFDKYGPEINSYLAKVPFKQRTIDNLNTVVKLVKADHVDELASEIASQRFAGQAESLRSNGSPTPPVAQQEPKYTLKSDKIPEDWSKRAAEAGLTESAVDEFCRANNMDRKTFFEQFGKTAITEVTRRG